VLSCRKIPAPRLVLYAAYFATGARFSELTSLRVRDYQREMLPLHCLTLHAAKVSRHKAAGQVRHVPVLAELQEWLDWWLDEEYEVLFGTAPRPDDVLFPTISPRRRNKGLMTCSHGEIAWWWREHDLPAAGLRHRRIHDSRRTFISLLRSARARDEVVRKITHWSTADEVLDAYTEWEWDAFCREVQALKLGFPPPPRGAAVVSLEPEARTEGRANRHA
jgi:integrase